MKGSVSIDAWITDWELARDLAQSFADSVRKGLGARVKRLRLYGSAFRGDWTPSSDIDVLVLLDHVETPDTEWIVQQATRTGLLEHGILIQPLIMTSTNFERLTKQERRFALEVERSGEDL